MKAWPEAWVLKPAERVCVLLLCLVLLAAWAVRCRRLRIEQPGFVPPPEALVDR